MNEKKFKLTPAELKAIEDHKYFMSKLRGREVSIEEAIEDFLKLYAEAWHREKHRGDMAAQIQEIEKYKYYRSQHEGRDIGRVRAAEEWCRQYAPIWRAERESLERNGFVQILVQIRNKNGLHMRPTSALALLAGAFDCDVYVHKPAMEYYNFILKDKPYMNVKSVLNFLSLGIIIGDILEFIATGAQAQEALAAIRNMITDDGSSLAGLSPPGC